MDRITKSLLDEFISTQEIVNADESENFEDFCNYTIISNEYNKTFDVDLAATGSGNDSGIDGIAILVNGHFVESLDEVDDLLKSNGYLEVRYIFIQAKRSSSLDTKDILHFFLGVQDFFSESPRLPRNGEITHFSEISNYLYNKAADFKENPIIKLFYTYTGVYNNDGNISAVIDSGTETIRELNIFENIDIDIIGANELGKLYRKTKNPISSSFIFSEKVTLPEIRGVEQSYYGVLPFLEFKKLLIDENNNIQSVFEDNVRDYQGNNNTVNSGIHDTLSSDNPCLFSVLNNGVTIVANSIKTSGNSITITDYQIVNGCQTSNVLFECRNVKDIDNVSIPLRLIVTQDDEVKSMITVSTNNQTAIKKEQLSAMSDFQKNLEHYYSAMKGDNKLYYERRAKQYNSNSDVIKRRIITIPNQIKSFSSMFRKDPHSVTTYFGKLAKVMGNRGSDLCEKDHQFAPYYLAGLAFYKLDSLFNSGDLDKKYRKVKFYITMLVPMISSSEDFPPLNSQKKTESYCQPIIDKLNDEELCKKIFKTAVGIIERSGVEIEDKQSLKSKQMTLAILNAYKEEKV